MCLLKYTIGIIIVILKIKIYIIKCKTILNIIIFLLNWTLSTIKNWEQKSKAEKKIGTR